MEHSSILHFFENKSILVTGATGSLAKVLIEKILRVQPNVKKLYLLLRAPDSNSALHRFNNEVMAKDLFRIVREKYGDDDLIREKVSLVAGDITLESLGIEEFSLQAEILRQVQVVINLAATTDFDERYDIAFGINTIGPLNVLNFSRNCSKLRLFLHVSTAYVCGEKEGIVVEKLFKMGDTLNGARGLDISTEKEVIEGKLKELKAEQKSYISPIMKDLGIQRANKYGWPNTYAFTKAMGEMLLGKWKDKVPLVIIRPTIITSTYKEPFPGWLEGVRNIDSFVVGYGKGKISCFPGDPQTIVDLIPADMVVNAMIVAVVAHADQTTDHAIYHVGSSMANPVLYSSLQDYGLRYFTEQPWLNKDREPVIVRKCTKLSTETMVNIYISFHYLIPLKILGLVNTASCQYFEDAYVDLSRKVKFLMRLVQLFKPYLFFKGVFDDINTEKLRRAVRENEVEDGIFYFDPRTINWAEYFMYTHIAAVVKYGFKR
ncbi:hypothetical protein RD792_009858 [Penstemon davidsonii]|uniref:Fatty acyl-CoA reductase n=1 Tax=Penstemon davidsonii TaxID=160366 RepID=A0ABR0D1E9_9LAMI|nr:hypothetical protein RD792_009858 [Penstemon davidsonii]